MKVLYLINLYPKVSHTFIRREIEGVEAAGVEVERASLRRVAEPLVDPADKLEEQKTWVVLEAGFFRLLGATLLTALQHPIRFLGAICDVIKLGRPSERGVIYHFAYLVEACALAQKYGRSIDHVHAHFATNPTTVALLWNRLGGPSFSFTAHGTNDFDSPAAVSMPEKVRRSRFAVAVCQYGRGQMMRWTEERLWNRIHVVRCGVEKQFLQHEVVPIPTAPRFVCVARFSREKALPVLLNAVARIVADGQEIELTLAGDGPLKAALELQIEELGIGAQVRLPGLLSGPEVVEEILRARAMILPSFAEGLPVVIMEALALRRPVIATAITGIPELVKPGVSGWLVPTGSVASLTQAMREVLKATPVELARLGKGGAERVARLHDAELEGARLAELFLADDAQHTLSEEPEDRFDEPEQSSRVA